MKTNTFLPCVLNCSVRRFFGAMLVVALMMPAVAFSQTVYTNPATVDLLTAGNFRILAGSTITINTGTTVTGDVGVSPGTTVTNNGTVNGTIHLNDASAIQAQLDLTEAYNNAAGRTVNETVATELGGTTLGRGVYTAASGTFEITTTLTLTGTASDIFIFKMASTLTTGASSHVTLTGGALASNVFWQVGSSATIDGDFKGIILALTAITQNTGTSSIDGRLLARNSFVTVGGTSVLPVELTSFTAVLNNSAVELNWSTATEVNNYGFDIERSQMTEISSQHFDWKKIGFVAGAGNSNRPKNYSFTDNNPVGGTSFSYRLKQIDINGNFKYYDAITVSLSSSTKAELMQNSPNPFNPSTAIKFYIPNNSDVTIKIYNILGREVTTLINNQTEAGYHIVYWNGRDRYGSETSSGVYFYRLTAGNFSETRKMLMMK